MFTGIIEDIGQIEKITKEQSNLILTISSKLASELQINQSIAHNGICLTVIEVKEQTYSVCAVEETIKKTNIGLLEAGDLINLERCLVVGDRLDGHIVQGHVDDTVTCIQICERKGSWQFIFKYDHNYQDLISPMGSIALNGISLTISKIDENKNYFETSIIPHTFNQTNLKLIKEGDLINVEFDIISKQILRLYQNKL